MADPAANGVSDAQIKTMVQMQQAYEDAKKKKEETEREVLVGVCEHLEQCATDADLEDLLLAVHVGDIRNPTQVAEIKTKIKANFFKYVKIRHLLRPAKKLSFGSAAYESTFTATKLRKQVYTFFEEAAEAGIPKATLSDVVAALAYALALCNKWGCSQETSTLLSQLLEVSKTCVSEWHIEVPTYIETMTKEVWSPAAAALDGGRSLPSLHAKSTYTMLFSADAVSAQQKRQEAALAAALAAPRGRGPAQESSHHGAGSGRDDRERYGDRDRGRDRDRDHRSRDERRESSSGARAHRSQSEPPAKRAKPEVYSGSQAERMAAVLRDMADHKVNIGSICTNFNAAKGCSYQNCKYTHVCLTCVKANRSEINHAAGSAAECK